MFRNRRIDFPAEALDAHIARLNQHGSDAAARVDQAVPRHRNKVDQRPGDSRRQGARVLERPLLMTAPAVGPARNTLTQEPASGAAEDDKLRDRPRQIRRAVYQVGYSALDFVGATWMVERAGGASLKYSAYMPFRMGN